MNLQEAKELAKLGKKMLDPEVYAEVQRLTNPNAAFGPKVLGGPVPPAEHILTKAADGTFEVNAPKPETVAKPSRKEK